MNIWIAIICLIIIWIDIRLTKKSPATYLRNHMYLLGIKIALAALAIVVFVLIDYHKAAIMVLTGSMTLIVFHFIEAFIVQRILLKNGNNK